MFAILLGQITTRQGKVIFKTISAHIINMPTLMILFFVLSCLALAGCGGLLVKSLEKISTFLRLREFAAAFILMAVATSLPELFVGISSALNKNPALSLGNVIGANIINITLVIGIVVLIAKGKKIKDGMINRDAWIVLAIASLPLVLLYDKVLSRIDGIILVSVFCMYAYYLLKYKARNNKLRDHVSRWAFLGYTLLFLGAVVGLILTSKFVVQYASQMSIALFLPPIFIGLFMLSFGTTLPELAFGASAALKGKVEMAMGDAIGSVAANSTLILGVTAIIYPVSGNMFLIMISAIFMLLSIFLFATFLQSERRISLVEGIALIFLYVFFLIITLTLKSLGIN